MKKYIKVSREWIYGIVLVAFVIVLVLICLETGDCYKNNEGNNKENGISHCERPGIEEFAKGIEDNDTLIIHK